ncbi:VPS15 [Brettanomyces bruxellensis]|uniref:non-specific serine/threonine protein kinase n=1 Tax=Dekkera bruxellensis TaxID=5007 RepID=A0A7D9GXU2_DEKBR|nr:VPS15 [Brettanomyces bruxellensis]
MEPELALMVPSAQTVAISAYIDFLPEIQYSKPVGTSRFLKAVKCLDKNGTAIVKLLIKPTSEINLGSYLEEMEKTRIKLVGLSNALPYHLILDSQRACYFIRPYLRYNLYERLSIRPFLEDVEKKWIIYQLLTALSQFHAKGVTHGDLKTENILLTSWNWCMITDFATIKPTYLPDRNPLQFSFYFDTAQRHSCCLAPERFVSLSDEETSKMNTKEKVTESMDIFALGCVIAEIYTEGLPIFTLSQMFKYKKGQYIPNLDSVKDSNVRKMIKSMISLNPEERLSASEYLQKFRKLVFPDYFYTFLYAYVKDLSTNHNSDSATQFGGCDRKINCIYNDFGKIAFYLNFKRIATRKSPQSFNEPIGSIIPMEINLPGVQRHAPRPTSEIFTNETNGDCAGLIILSVVLYTLRNTTHASLRMKACELILAIAEQLHDEAKLDRCLPYLIYMLDDPGEDVQGTALRTLTQLLKIVDTVTPMNTSIFPDYLLPKLESFLRRSYTNEEEAPDLGKDKNSISYIRTIFASCLPHLALSSKRFKELSVLMTMHIKTFNDPEIENHLTIDDDSYIEEGYQRTIRCFENLTIQIMTDPDANVRIGLLRNILPLCTFFGRDKTNDVILSHLITYLNDKNTQLKLAFVSSIVTISITVGIVSLEQYILPLLVQALTDPSELVVFELLRVFTELIGLGLIRKQYLLNLVKFTVKLTLHPNTSIREAALNLTITAGKQLSFADLYCMLYPIIRPYFKHEITSFRWSSLFILSQDPIPRSVYTITKSWSLKNEPTLFWQRSSSKKSQGGIDLFGNLDLPFMRKESSDDNRYRNLTRNYLPHASDVVGNLEIPLSTEDFKQISRLKNIGFENSELWKIATLRLYIYKVAHASYNSSNRLKDNTSYSNRLKILPRSVFIDISYSHSALKNASQLNSESRSIQRNGTSEVILEPKSKFEENDNSKGKPKLVISSKVSLPSTEQSRDIARGNTWTSSGLNAEGKMIYQGSIISGGRIININKEEPPKYSLVTKMKYSYNGNNRYIIKFLKSLHFEPELTDYQEFGKAIKRSGMYIHQKHTDEAVSDFKNNSISKNVSKKSLLISQIAGSDSLLEFVISSCDGAFLITGDKKGDIKVWDSTHLESPANTKIFCSLSLGSRVTSLCGMSKYNCFAVATEDRMIRIIRMEPILLSNVVGKPKKAASVKIIRQYKTKEEEGFASILKFCNEDNQLTDDTLIPHLVYCTVRSKIVFIDIREMKPIYIIQNDLSHGIPTAICVGSNLSWLLIGSSEGILDLWDPSLMLHMNSVGFRHQSYQINNLEFLPHFFETDLAESHYVAAIGGTGKADVIIWDISDLRPAIVLCSSSVSSSVDTYNVKDLDEKNKVSSEDTLAPTNFLVRKEDIEIDQSCTAMEVVFPLSNDETTGILCSTPAGEIILWNLSDYGKSRVIVHPDKHRNESQKNEVSFAYSKVNSHLSFVNEVHANGNNARYLDNEDTFQNGHVDKSENDIIKDITVLLDPYNLIVSVNRSGTINVNR